MATRVKMSWEEEDRILARARAELVAGGVVAPVKRGREEGRRWVDCELAAFAENRLGERLDPFTLDPGTRDRWEREVLGGRPEPPAKRSYQDCYWIVHEDGHAGTIGVGRRGLSGFVWVESVYLRPPFRGRGIMAGAIRHVRTVLEAHGLGLRLETDWTWQGAVRFYLGRGLWLRSWKRALAFVGVPKRPAPIVSVGRHRASIRVESEGEIVVLARVERKGDRLVYPDRDAELWRNGEDHLATDAWSTLALAMALEGWPLIRSERHWERCRFSDFFHPEALAARIREWEAWSAGQGWRVETPRIPGVGYPTWSELSDPDRNGSAPARRKGNRRCE